MKSRRADAGAVPSELVDVLVTAVEGFMQREGRPLEATRLGNVLGDAYRQRHLPTGPGAYKPVMEAAIRAGRLQKVWGEDRTRMALMPIAKEVPDQWTQEEPHSPSPRPLTRLPGELLHLRREIFDAFAGIRAPVSLDLTAPPFARVVPGDAGMVVQPLRPEAVVQAWSAFAATNQLSEAATTAVADALGGQASTVWSRIEIPCDGPHLRLGSKFHRARLDLLVAHVREWFVGQGKNPDDFELTRQLSKTRATTPLAPSVASADRVQPLRERLKRIIDRMSLEQLHELRIPAEYLDA